jgi:hypothetical protein
MRMSSLLISNGKPFWRARYFAPRIRQSSGLSILCRVAASRERQLGVQYLASFLFPSGMSPPHPTHTLVGGALPVFNPFFYPSPSSQERGPRPSTKQRCGPRCPETPSQVKPRYSAAQSAGRKVLSHDRPNSAVPTASGRGLSPFPLPVTCRLMRSAITGGPTYGPSCALPPASSDGGHRRTHC